MVVLSSALWLAPWACTSPPPSDTEVEDTGACEFPACGGVPETALDEFGRLGCVAVRSDGLVGMASVGQQHPRLVIGFAPSASADFGFAEPVGSAVADAGQSDCAFGPDGRLVVATGRSGGVEVCAISRWNEAECTWLSVAAQEPPTPSLAFDASGAVHLAFSEAAVLRHAFGAPSAALAVETVPPPCAGCSEAGYGDFSDIASGGGRLLVAYHDQTGGDLYLTERSPTRYTTTLVAGRDPETGEDLGDAGTFPALLVSASGNVLLSYRDESRGVLMLAHTESGALVRTAVDDGRNSTSAAQGPWQNRVGAPSALFLDSQGRAMLFYLDATSWTVRKAVRDGHDFALSTLPLNGPAGLWLSAAAAPSGPVVVAFEQWTPATASTGRFRRATAWVDL